MHEGETAFQSHVRPWSQSLVIQGGGTGLCDSLKKLGSDTWGHSWPY